jgi:SH3-like domain-containing protein
MGYRAICAACMLGVLVGGMPAALVHADAAAVLAAPTRGVVTNLPLPRFVSLKGSDGNARRGPGLSHRIDWVFTRRGMPLQIVAEFENWRRVVDKDGEGGWVHYTLLSGARSVLVQADMADLHVTPSDAAQIIARFEAGVIAQVQECTPDWCRISSGGYKGWVKKTALWGVGPAEILD